MANTKERLTDAAGNVRPYVERAVADEELRANVKAAFQTAREVYDELIGGRGVTTVATRRERWAKTTACAPCIRSTAA